MALSAVTAFTPIPERSEATPGLFNARLQQVQDNVVSLLSNVSTHLGPYFFVETYLADGATDFVGLQRAVDAASVAGGQVILPARTLSATSYLQVAGPNVSIIGIPGKSGISWSSFVTFSRAFGFVAEMRGGIVADHDNFLIEGVTLTGPRSTNTYHENEALISSVGTSSSQRRQQFTVKRCELSRSGAYGIYTQWVSRPVVEDSNYIHDVGYNGCAFLSCDNIRFTGNRVSTVTPGSNANMYGVTIDHDSSNYSSDVSAGTKFAANPFSERAFVAFNEVEDVNWEGIDCHGGYEIQIVHNRVFNTKFGISCPSGSGSAASFAGYNNVVAFNVVDARTSSGTRSGRENVGYGINVSGGASTQTRHQNIRVVGNTLINKGVVADNASAAILAQFTRGLLVDGNVVQKWGGVGVGITSAENVTITNNQFLELSVATDAVGTCIFTSTALPNEAIVHGNSLSTNGGTAARIGFSGAAATSRPWLSDNNFLAATVNEYALAAPGFVNGSAVAAIVNSSDGSTTPTLGGCRAPHVLMYCPSTASFTISNIVGGYEGQMVTLVNTGNNTILFSRANAVLKDGAIWDSNTNDSLTLRKGASSWIELSRSSNA